MTVWRDAQEQEEKLGRHNTWKPVCVLGIDGAYVLGLGEKRPVLVAVELAEGQPVAVGYVNEHDPVAVQRWMEPLVQRMGISVIVTDDLATYKVVVKRQPGTPDLPVPRSALGGKNAQRIGERLAERVVMGISGDQGTDG